MKSNKPNKKLYYGDDEEEDENEEQYFKTSKSVNQDNSDEDIEGKEELLKRLKTSNSCFDDDEEVRIKESSDQPSQEVIEVYNNNKPRFKKRNSAFNRGLNIYSNNINNTSTDELDRIQELSINSDDDEFGNETSNGNPSTDEESDDEIGIGIGTNNEDDSEIKNNESTDRDMESLTNTDRLLLTFGEEDDLTVQHDNEVVEEGDAISIFTKARNNLHISTIPDSVPERDREKTVIRRYLQAKLKDGNGGCLYISGMPGTGKTTTIKEIIRAMQQNRNSTSTNPFTFIEINAMDFTHPHQIYPMLYRKMHASRKNKRSITYKSALDQLNTIFSSNSKKKAFRIVLVDEFDRLVTSKQSVIYNLFEWPNKTNSKLIIIAIANTMNLPETLLPRVQSRMGLHRISFSAYNTSQLSNIVKSRLKNLEAFDQDAIDICAMRVSAVCGDARRALEICREATSQAENEFRKLRETNLSLKPGKVTASHISTVLDQISSHNERTLKNCSLYEKLFLFAFYKEQQAAGVTNIHYGRVCNQLKQTCKINTIQFPNSSQLSLICGTLGLNRILLVEEGPSHYYQVLQLNINLDDLIFSLSVDKQIENLLQREYNENIFIKGLDKKDN